MYSMYGYAFKKSVHIAIIITHSRENLKNIIIDCNFGIRHLPYPYLWNKDNTTKCRRSVLPAPENTRI